MKAILSLFLVLTTLKAQTIPTVQTGALASSKCQSVSAGANSTSNEECTSCFTWGTATLAYDSAASGAAKCATSLSTGLITSCQIYAYQHSNTVSILLPNFDSCTKCEKTYYNVIRASNGGDMSATCSDDKGTGCTGKIKNCYQTVCYSSFSNNVSYSSQFCRRCKPGYFPAEIDIFDIGA